MEKVVEQKTPETPPAGLTEERVRAIVTEAAKPIGDEMVKAARDLVTELRKDDAARFAEIAKAVGVTKPEEKGAGSGITVVNRGIFRYERMYRENPASRAFRFPEADQAAAEWLRAMAGHNGAGPVPLAALAANKRLLELFGEDTVRNYYCGTKRSGEGHADVPTWEGARGLRANLLEGTTTASSGLSGGSAGPLIPLPLELSIVEWINKSAKLRQFCPIYNSVAKTLRVPVRSSSATAAMVAEGAVAAQGEPTFAGQLFDKKKMQALFGVSKETLLDSAFDLVSVLAQAAGGHFGELEDNQACTSNGTAPNFSANITTGVTDVAEASSTVLTYADLVTLWYQLPEQYQVGAMWVIAANVAPFLSRLVITGGMGPVLVPKTGPFTTIGDLANAQGAIFGAPVIINQLANGAIWLGRPDLAYGFLESPGIIFEESVHAGWATDTVQYKFTRRIDGQSLLTGAARTMTGLASIA